MKKKTIGDIPNYVKVQNLILYVDEIHNYGYILRLTQDLLGFCVRKLASDLATSQCLYQFRLATTLMTSRELRALTPISLFRIPYTLSLVF